MLGCAKFAGPNIISNLSPIFFFLKVLFRNENPFWQGGERGLNFTEVTLNKPTSTSKALKSRFYTDLCHVSMAIKQISRDIISIKQSVVLG